MNVFPPAVAWTNKQTEKLSLQLKATKVRDLNRCVYKRTKYTTNTHHAVNSMFFICYDTCTHGGPIFTSRSQAIKKTRQKEVSTSPRAGDWVIPMKLLRMRSLISLTLLTTIQIVDNSLSSKDRDDLKQSDENNDFQFDVSHEPSGDKSQQFCEGNSDRCKVRSM